MPQQNLFDEVADIGKAFLSLSRGNQALQNYTWQLKGICDLIKHTHSILVVKLDEIEAATSADEAKELVEQLENGPLMNSFKANGLCDIFQGFGTSLRKLVSHQNFPAGPAEQIPNLSAWHHLCDSLEEREGQVASLYSHEIQEIADLVWGMDKNSASLDEVKVAAQRAKNVLTTQMSNFDSLATQFEQLLKERN